ncbi:MAG: preprotein translocase subunit SecG [Planctomycetes bacterium]|nr:preprotein translocase subunit SecG [Planctomycetota bacterium]
MIASAWYHSILATLFGLLAIMLMLVILLQRGKGVGLSGAFGGAGGHTTFGSKTGDFLTWVTIALAALFLVYSVGLNYVFVPTTPNLGGSGTGGTGTTGGSAPPAETPEGEQGAWHYGNGHAAPEYASHAIFGIHEV